MVNYLAAGNTKTGRKTLSFSLPRLGTCKPSVWCIKHCYANKGHFSFKSIKAIYQRNLELSLNEDFPTKMIEEINRRKPKNVRIHVSGDFYSKKYIRDWATIINNCPNTNFKVFTRRDDFINELMELNKLPNISLHYSIDESSSVELLTKVYGKLKLANVANNRFNLRTFVDCGEGCTQCNFACWNKTNNVTLNLR